MSAKLTEGYYKLRIILSVAVRRLRGDCLCCTSTLPSADAATFPQGKAFSGVYRKQFKLLRLRQFACVFTSHSYTHHFERFLQPLKKFLFFYFSRLQICLKNLCIRVRLFFFSLLLLLNFLPLSFSFGYVSLLLAIARSYLVLSIAIR